MRLYLLLAVLFVGVVGVSGALRAFGGTRR